MLRELEFESRGRVVHIVGTLNEQVMAFLAPAAQALARSGREQSVVMIDEARFRHHLPRLHESAELVMAPAARNPLRQWAALHQACCSVLERGPLHAVHMHGLMPALVGAQAVRTVQADSASVFFSPYGAPDTTGASLLTRVLRSLLFRSRGSAIVDLEEDSRAFEDWPSSRLLENPVSDHFFALSRQEARYPLIVTRSESARSAELLAQLAVLLSGTELRIGFNCIGTVDAVSRRKLEAAGVGVFEIATEDACAARMAPAWIYLALPPQRGYPHHLAEAMAAGLPCVAADCAQHRALMREGQTGFLCSNERQMIERLAELIDAADLRQQIGTEARRDAERRFSESVFGSKLLATYERPT